MSYRFEFQPYRRSFRQPLQTSHGIWGVREGILLRLTDAEGRVAHGEIAPLPWFGSESYSQAVQFCRQRHQTLEPDLIFSIPEALPACQMGFESVWADLHPVTTRVASLKPLQVCGLLPTGHQALERVACLWDSSYRTFKYKIGVLSLREEQQWVRQLAKCLPQGGKLRLDANGGLELQDAEAWLDLCDRIGIEFLEQPLPAEQFEPMLQLAQRYTTPIALDESVATVQQLEACYQRGWRGIFVIKPAIAGSPRRLRAFCEAREADFVFSSVFETPIGRQAALRLAADLNTPHRAVGFGTGHWFADDLDTLDAQQIWQRLASAESLLRGRSKA